MADIVHQHIQQYGWHCLHVFPDAEGQELFTYSIGFAESFDAPEVVVFGLAREKAHALLSECAALLKSGESIETEVEDDRILAGGYRVVFRPVRADAFREYLGAALRYYGEKSFQAVVMFMPDRGHRFPWHSDYAGANADESLSIV